MARNSKDDSLGRKRKVEEIRDMYFDATRRIRESGDPPESLPEYKECAAVRNIIEAAFGVLDPVSRMIINRDFFYNDYANWWVGIYSKTSYYRLRDKAIRTFLKETERLGKLRSGGAADARLMAI